MIAYPLNVLLGKAGCLAVLIDPWRQEIDPMFRGFFEMAGDSFAELTRNSTEEGAERSLYLATNVLDVDCITPEMFEEMLMIGAASAAIGLGHLKSTSPRMRQLAGMCMQAILDKRWLRGGPNQSLTVRHIELLGLAIATYDGRNP